MVMYMEKWLKCKGKWIKRIVITVLRKQIKSGIIMSKIIVNIIHIYVYII